MHKCSFQFLSGGSRDSDTYFDFHSHQAYELVYYLKGSGYTTINGVRYDYFPNTLALTQPGHMHDEYHKDDTYVAFVIFTYEGDIAQLTDCLLYDNTGYAIKRILDEMKREYYSESSHYKIKLDLLTQQLVIELARLKENTKSNDNLSLSMKYLNENYTGSPDYKILAERAGYSYNQFRRLVKKHTGLSPVNYIIQKRLENARNLLKCTSLPISHISSESGFATSSQFCSMFKKALGLTPKEYRKENTLIPNEFK